MVGLEGAGVGLSKRSLRNAGCVAGTTIPVTPQSTLLFYLQLRNPLQRPSVDRHFIFHGGHPLHEQLKAQVTAHAAQQDWVFRRFDAQVQKVDDLPTEAVDQL